MEDNKFIKTYYIEDIHQLFDIIQGRGDFPDLREDFIFRGLSKSSYDLIPSALRKDDDKWIINDYIQDSEFSLYCALPPKQYYDLGLITEEEYNSLGDNGIIISFRDKNLESIDENLHSDSISNKNDIYFKRESYVLLKFFSRADKSGLKVPINQRIREFIHLKYDYGAKNIFIHGLMKIILS